MLARIYIGVGHYSLDIEQEYERYLVDTVGGFTRFDGTGGWRDDNVRYYEPSVVYELVTSKATAIVVAMKAKAVFEQEAVLVVFIEAESEMI